ncbi:MAG: hypothetical protein P8X74_17010, partial [Reinekea sp.]
QDVVTILKFFWPNQKVTEQNITPRMILFVDKIMHESKLCSDRMDWVPRPAGVKPSPKWVLKQIKKVAQRVRDKHPDIYNLCKSTVASNMISEYRDILYVGF